MDERRDDKFKELEEHYSSFAVYDSTSEKIGKVDYLFVNENDQPEYIGVKIDLLEPRFNLIPWELARVDEEQRRIEIPVDKDRAKEGPAFEDNEEITLQYEEQVRRYYGLSGTQGLTKREPRGEYYEDEERSDRGARERARQPGRGLEDEDELRVRRVEEELVTGTRKREAGGVRVRKRVRTDREQLKVPKRREEVLVDRVPVEEGRETSETEISEGEIRIPIVEEEIVVEKRPVVKEEVRLRKDVVEDEQVVEEDVRKEEIDVADETKRARRREADVDDEVRRRNR